MNRFRWIIALLSVLCVACNVADPVSSSNELDPQEGTGLAGADQVSPTTSVVWSADGGEIYYEATDGSLRAASVSQAGTRIVEASRDIREITGGQADRAVYYVADPGAGHSAIFRSANGTTTSLTDRAPATTPLGAVDGTLVLSGPGDAVVAYIVAPDSLFEFEVATETHRFITTGCVRVVTFSPDGGRLICRREGPRDGGFALVDRPNRTTEGITVIPADPTVNPRLVRWFDDTVRLLFSADGRFRIRAVGQTQTFTVWQPPPGIGPRAIDFINYAWSGDGLEFAFWAHECIKINVQGACTFGQSILHIVDLATNLGTQAVVVKGNRGGEQVAFSPDRQSVAYVFNGRIWVRDLN
jgi:hypothetical protein